VSASVHLSLVMVLAGLALLGTAGRRRSLSPAA
jgi:hypothetical protein